MKSIFKLVPVCTGLVLLAGCSSARQSAVPADHAPEAAKDAAVAESAVQLTPENAEELGAGIIRAWLDGDYRKFAAVLPPAQRERYKENAYRKLLAKFAEKLGRAENIRFFGRMKNGEIDTFIWNVSFVAEAKGTPGKTAQYDMLYRLSLRKNSGGTYDITAIGW